MSVNVTYKGNSIAEMTETGTKTLKTGGKYCEADIVVENTESGGAEITDGIVVKARNDDNFPTSVEVHCSGNKLWKYALAGGRTSQFRFLNEVTFADTMTDFRDNYVFYMTPIEHIILPDAVWIGTLTFYDVYSKTIFCPKCVDINASRVVAGDRQLESIQFGSVGHGVIASRSDTFANVSKAIPVTLFTVGNYVDTLLSNVRNGCTNATIIIKASEDTEYNSTVFAAGETIIESTVEATS